MADYIRILVVKIKRIFTDELKIYRSRDDLSDEVVDEIIKTAYSTYDQNKGEI